MSLNSFLDVFCTKARVSKEQDHILIIPKGLSFAEASASNLVGETAIWSICILFGGIMLDFYFLIDSD